MSASADAAANAIACDSPSLITLELAPAISRLHVISEQSEQERGVRTIPLAAASDAEENFAPDFGAFDLQRQQQQNNKIKHDFVE